MRFIANCNIGSSGLRGKLKSKLYALEHKMQNPINFTSTVAEIGNEYLGDPLIDYIMHAYKRALTPTKSGFTPIYYRHLASIGKLSGVRGSSKWSNFWDTGLVKTGKFLSKAQDMVDELDSPDSVEIIRKGDLVSYKYIIDFKKLEEACVVNVTTTSKGKKNSYALHYLTLLRRGNKTQPPRDYIGTYKDNLELNKWNIINNIWKTLIHKLQVPINIKSVSDDAKARAIIEKRGYKPIFVH